MGQSTSPRWALRSVSQIVRGAWLWCSEVSLESCRENLICLRNYRHVLPHGSYLVNLAQNDKAKAKQAYDSFLDDLRRCEALGITLYNFQSAIQQSKQYQKYYANPITAPEARIKPLFLKRCLAWRTHSQRLSLRHLQWYPYLRQCVVMETPSAALCRNSRIF